MSRNCKEKIKPSKATVTFNLSNNQELRSFPRSSSLKQFGTSESSNLITKKDKLVPVRKVNNLSVVLCERCNCVSQEINIINDQINDVNSGFFSRIEGKSTSDQGLNYYKVNTKNKTLMTVEKTDNRTDNFNGDIMPLMRNQHDALTEKNHSSKSLMRRSLSFTIGGEEIETDRNIGVPIDVDDDEEEERNSNRASKLTLITPTTSTMPNHNNCNNFIRRNESSHSFGYPTMSSNELQITRRPSILLQEILTTRRPSGLLSSMRNQGQKPRIMGSLYEDPNSGSNRSINTNASNCNTGGAKCDMAIKSRKRNRRIGDDAISTALSVLYCKLIVILGIALPVTEIISSKIPLNLYQGFYVYLYLGSITFVMFIYGSSMKSRTLFNIIKTYHEKTHNLHIKRKATRFGSFYLRVGAIAFGIGTMVYSGLEFGQYFELNGNPGCKNVFIALTPAARMALSIVQMQFIFLNTTELDMAKHKVIARFGLMHMIATNLCEWLYVLVEETKHEIYHFGSSKIPEHQNSAKMFSRFVLNTTASIITIPLGENIHNNNTDLKFHSNTSNNLTESFFPNNSDSASSGVHHEMEQFINCQRTNIMGSLVQNAAPFLFPCTIEYSLICAVILYEMWKKVKSIPDIAKTRATTQKLSPRGAHHFSVDCSRAHRGLFSGILIIVLTIISMIMYFVLYEEPGYELLAMQEITVCEIVMYTLTCIAVILAMIRMRDLKFLCRNDRQVTSMSLDCTLLCLAQVGVYVYGMFSIIGSYFSMSESVIGGQEGLAAEAISLIQTSLQTLFILNACWRRCKGAQQQRTKPGREIITFLLVANVSMWFVNTLIKSRAAFRNSHLMFFGVWAWTIITHVSMPLAIFYRFHSTICLFEIWKAAYKTKS